MRLIVTSKVERQLRRAGGTHPTTPRRTRRVQADDILQRRFMRQLDIYYDAVIASVRKAETILIFGPGEAKGEFRKRVMRAGIRAHIEEAETVDKMTDRQIAAKVRLRFEGDRVLRKRQCQ